MKNVAVQDTSADIRRVLDFWFGVNADLDDLNYLGKLNKLWFQGGAAFDENVKTQFTSLIETALVATATHTNNVSQAVESWPAQWSQTARGRLALILVLDQFPRNVFRGEARAFAGDELALTHAIECRASGQLSELHVQEQVFAAMPFQHAEDLEMQRESVEVFTEIVQRAPPVHQDSLKNSLAYAQEHHDVVAQFGRFPHRNEVSGRAATAAEIAYLDGGAKRYGQ